MATAIAPRSEVYVSLLAARAVTSLIRLANDPSDHSARVQDGLRDGVRYCQAVRSLGGGIFVSNSSDAWSPLRRAVEGSADSGFDSCEVCAESRKIELFLLDLLSGKREAATSELVEAIEFLRKTATQR